MTNRIRSYTVVLKEDTREDDAECIEHAIRMIKGVMDVTPEVADSGDYVAKMRAMGEMERKILKALRDD